MPSSVSSPSKQAQRSPRSWSRQTQPLSARKVPNLEMRRKADDGAGERTARHGATPPQIALSAGQCAALETAPGFVHSKKMINGAAAVTGTQSGT